MFISKILKEIINLLKYNYNRFASSAFYDTVRTADDLISQREY